MIMTIIIIITNELLVSDTLTVLRAEKIVYDLQNVTLSKLLNPCEPQLSLFSENGREAGILWGLKGSRK